MSSRTFVLPDQGSGCNVCGREVKSEVKIDGVNLCGYHAALIDQRWKAFRDAPAVVEKKLGWRTKNKSKPSHF